MKSLSSKLESKEFYSALIPIYFELGQLSKTRALTETCLPKAPTHFLDAYDLVANSSKSYRLKDFLFAVALERSKERKMVDYARNIVLNHEDLFETTRFDIRLATQNNQIIAQKYDGLRKTKDRLGYHADSLTFQKLLSEVKNSMNNSRNPIAITAYFLYYSQHLQPFDRATNETLHCSYFQLWKHLGFSFTVHPVLTAELSLLLNDSDCFEGFLVRYPETLLKGLKKTIAFSQDYQSILQHMAVEYELADELLAIFQTRPVFTRAQFQSDMQISRMTAMTYLEHYEVQGLLTQTSKGPSKLYWNPTILSLMEKYSSELVLAPEKSVEVLV